MRYRWLIQDSVTGLLLAGIGQLSSTRAPNYLVVDAKTPLATVEQTFLEFTQRKDIAIVLINQHLADTIREMIDGCAVVNPGTTRHSRLYWKYHLKIIRTILQRYGILHKGLGTQTSCKATFCLNIQIKLLRYNSYFLCEFLHYFTVTMSDKSELSWIESQFVATD